MFFSESASTRRGTDALSSRLLLRVLRLSAGSAPSLLSSSRKGCGLPAGCTDCGGSTDSISVHIYPTEPERYAEGLRTADNACPTAAGGREHGRTRAAGSGRLHPPPCNGTAGGKRLEADGTLYPSNHDRMRPGSRASPLLADGRGTPSPGAIQSPSGSAGAGFSPLSYKS